MLDAARAVLVERGFEGISLERVADRAGLSRVTLWRQGITKDVLVTGLLQRLSDDFQREFWPVLNGSGTGRDRLAACLTALFEVADRHLDLLAVSDEVFHWATERCDFPAGSHGFLWPFIGALRAGQADGSLAGQGRLEDAGRRLVQHRLLGLRPPSPSPSMGAQAGARSDLGRPARRVGSPGRVGHLSRRRPPRRPGRRDRRAG